MKVVCFVKRIPPCYQFNLYKRIITRTIFFPSLIARSLVISSGNHETYSYNTRITSCFKKGDIDSARKLFDEMPQRNWVTWNCMISGFSRNHMISEARQVFDVMPTKNLVSWTAMLSGYIGCGKLDDAKNLFDQIPVEMKTHVCWDIMINGYLKFGCIFEARELFDRSINPNVGLYNRMLSGYVQMGSVDEALVLFSSMPEHDLTSWTRMISCYAKAGLMDKAKTMFDAIPYEKDALVWTTIIQGYMQIGMVDEALRLFDVMPDRDVVAWNCMIGGFVQNGRMREALDFYGRMPRRNIVSSNTILHGFVQEGDMTSARSFFENVMNRKDITSWNTLVSGYQTEEALLVFCEMLRCGIRPDLTSYTTIVSICGLLALRGWGQAIHLQAIKTGYIYDALVSSSLISMYSKCGLIDYAAAMFESTEKRDTVMWNTIIVAQAYHGSPRKALELYISMKQAGNEPNHITFLALLTACAHWGLVEEGQNYIKSMQNDWNLTPQAEHYACMVDLFGRSGMLYEAYELVKQLPGDLPSYIWETLLNCCKLHGNFELGEIVSQRILRISPSNAEMNVILSNIYAAKGLWNESANVRNVMKQQDVKKVVGCSWVELEGSICKFFSNDRSHPQTNEIYKDIDNLSNIIKKISCNDMIFP